MVDYRTRVRVAMIPLDYSNKDKADINELMIDRDNDLIYINTNDGIKQYPNEDSVKTDTEIALKNKGITKNGGSSLGSIIKDSSELLEWINDKRKTNGDNIGTDDIFKIIKDISITDRFLDLIYNKVDKIVGKDLVSNNFTNYYKNKLSSIDKGAGIYEHPKQQICNYTPPVTSVNGKTGAISIYKTDINGLENMEMNANNYIHPVKKQCMHNFVIQEINSIHESHIILSKRDLDLGKVSNMRLLSYEDIHNEEEGYVTPNDLTKYIDYLLEEV